MTDLSDFQYTRRYRDDKKIELRDRQLEEYLNTTLKPRNIAVVTSSTRPTSNLYRGMAIFETDTGNTLVYYGSTTGWQLPWNQPWGKVASATGTTSGTSTTSTSYVDEGLVTGSATTLANRQLQIDLVVHPISSAGTIVGCSFQVVDNGTAAVLAVVEVPPGSIANTNAHTKAVIGISTSTAGTRTWKAQMKTTSSSGTIQSFASGAQSRVLVISDIGPAGTAPAS